MKIKKVQVENIKKIKDRKNELKEVKNRLKNLETEKKVLEGRRDIKERSTIIFDKKLNDVKTIIQFEDIINDLIQNKFLEENSLSLQKDKYLEIVLNTNKEIQEIEKEIENLETKIETEKEKKTRLEIEQENFIKNKKTRKEKLELEKLVDSINLCINKLNSEKLKVQSKLKREKEKYKNE